MAGMQKFNLSIRPVKARVSILESKSKSPSSSRRSSFTRASILKTSCFSNIYFEVRCMLVNLIESACISSDDKPSNVARTILEEIKSECLEQIDAQTIAERILSGVVERIQLKFDIEGNALFRKISQALTKFSIPKPKDTSFEDELKTKLGTTVLSSLDESKDIINSIIEELLERVVQDGKIVRTSKKHSESRKYSTCEELGEEEEEEETKEEIGCSAFAGVEIVSNKVIDKIVNQAKCHILVKHPDFVTNKIEDESNDSEEESSSEDVPFVEVFTRYKSVEWPKIEEFTPELGKVKIYEYLTTWYYYEDWLYCVNYQGSQSDMCADHYYYQSIWSIPTITYPIPQSTASVFFTLTASRVVPKYCRITVTYQFEGTRFVHTPELAEFHEEWLFNVIDAKINLFKTITF